MDFPISVPSVGLVAGKFVDEDPLLGTPGSLIPAQWGNAVTEEILNVLAAAGLTPNEGDNSQLARALGVARQKTVLTLSASAVLTAGQMGLLLLDAAAAARTFTLPASNAALGVVEAVLRRTDSSVNALVISAAGADKILLDTTAQAAGQTTTELLFAGDYLRLRSDGAGKWWCVGQCQLPGSIATGFTVISATGMSTYTVPAVLRSGRRWAKATVISGGGGGGRNSTGLGAGGGGGGGVAVKRINLAGVATVAVTVGVGGLGGATDGTLGTAGGASSFGGYCSALGGGGGPINGNAVLGSIGVGGDRNFSLGNSSPAVVGAGGGGIYGGFGGGAVSGISNLDPAVAANPGCGGGGRTASAGAAGAAGLVEISW